MKRKHISWKTKCASALLCLMSERDSTWYDDAKNMTKDQFLSLFHWDHNMFHETGREDRDEFWNLTPRLIHDHRRKTKEDAKIIAKGRRIRKRLLADGLMPQNVYDATEDFAQRWAEYQRTGSVTKPKQKRKIRSRGFDQTLRKKVNGKVERR